MAINQVKLKIVLADDLDFMREWEDGPDIAGCLSAGLGDEASGRVDVSSGVSVDVVKVLNDCPQPAVACTAALQAKAKESLSNPASIQVIVISLTGKTKMVVLSLDASVFAAA